MKAIAKLVLGSVAAFSVMTSAVSAQVLQPHLAVYDISLKEASDRSGIKGLEGRMVIEVAGGNCEGWSVNFRMVNQFLLDQGLSRTIDSRSSSWESEDGLRYHYTQSQHIDGNQTQEIRLKVKRGQLSETAKGTQTKDKQQEFELAAGTLFPVLHQQRLVELAASGKSHDSSIVFDGSEGPETNEVVAFVGPQVKAKPQRGEGADKLLSDQRSWPVVTSYFSAKEGAAKDTPDYKVSFRLFENGVAGDMVLDYGDFKLNAQLARLAEIEGQTCEQ